MLHFPENERDTVSSTGELISSLDVNEKQHMHSWKWRSDDSKESKTYTAEDDFFQEIKPGCRMRSWRDISCTLFSLAISEFFSLTTRV